MLTNPLFYLACAAALLGLMATCIALVWKLSESAKSKLTIWSLVILAIYWFMFGDYFSTIAVHKQYCDNEAGFKIYVTPEQWAAENPGVLETLVPYKKFTVQEHVELGNERVGMKFTKVAIANVAVQKNTETIIDIKTQKILSEYIDFSRGYGSFGTMDAHAVKFWLYSSSCYSNQELHKNVAIRKVFLKNLKTNWGN